MKFTIGCDPEVFFRNGNELVSVIGMLGGTKDSPFEFKEGFGLLEDNVAAEFNTPPANSADGFSNSIEVAMEYLSKLATDKGYSLSAAASGCFSMAQLSHPLAHVFGCEPDYNAWTGRKNPRPFADDPTLRSCGGHVHIGTDEFSTFEEKRAVIKACDLFLGVPSIRMDTDNMRRNLYGKAGAMRFKPYGVEYRTLSNFWIFNEDHRRWVYNQVSKSLSFLKDHGIKSLDEEEGAINSCINESNEDAFNYLSSKYYGQIYG